MNLEAQACGTFVITFDSGGAKETLSSVNNGVVVFEKSVKAIRKAIDNFKKRKTNLELPMVYLSKFSKTSFSNKYILLYEKVLSN